jgi:transposase
MPVNHVAYPWGPDSTVLGPESVNAEQKLWFVRQTLDCGISAPQLAARFDLNHHTVKQWVKTFRKRGKFEGKPGRPPLLDHQSLTTVDEYCRSHGYGDTTGLRDQIRTSTHSAMVKRGREVDYESEDEEPPSRRTMGRYLAIMKRDWAPPT